MAIRDLIPRSWQDNLRLRQRQAALIPGEPNTGTSAPGVPARRKRPTRRACADGAARISHR
jgi:hypothetical protein